MKMYGLKHKRTGTLVTVGYVLGNQDPEYFQSPYYLLGCGFENEFWLVPEKKMAENALNKTPIPDKNEGYYCTPCVPLAYSKKTHKVVEIELTFVKPAKKD